MRLIRKLRNSLVTRYASLLVLTLACVLGVGFATLYFSVQKLLNDSVNQEASLICGENVNYFDQSFFRCESIANMLAAVLEEKPPQDWSKVLNLTFKSFAGSDKDDLLAIGAATIPERGRGKLSLILHKPATGGARLDADSFQTLTGTRYADQSWFADVVKSGKGQWSEPFVGRIIHELLAVYSCPIYHTEPDGSKKLIGVVCVDIGIRWMDRRISGLSIDNHGHAFLLSDKLQLLSVPDQRQIGKKIAEVDDGKWNYLYPDGVAEGFERAKTQQRSVGFVVKHKQTGKNARLFLQPMHSTGWFFCILFQEDEICSPIRFFRSGVIVMTASIFIMIGGTVFLMTRRISRTLKDVRKFAIEIGKGNFAAPVPKSKGKDEHVILIATIDRMRLSLMKYIESLKRASADNERIESELLVAQRIQYGLIPNIRPPFPNSEFFEASARLFSAKEIGGDLYDCAMIAPDKLCFVIGDVAGKGIPASLFMVFTQVIQRVLRHDRKFSPKTLTFRMNDVLCSYNKGRLFVTFICGFIDAKTGIMTYCNAGHTPLLVVKQDGSLDDSCQRNGIPLGLRAGLPYTESECRLEPGDTIILYTDGIIEAENPDGGFYGLAQFKTLLRGFAGKNLSADQMVREIMNSVRRFSATCEQSDDIACLAVQYKKSASGVQAAPSAHC